MVHVWPMITPLGEKNDVAKSVSVFRRRPLSLRARLSLGLVALLLVGMIGLYVAAFVYGRTTADRLYDRLLATAARSTIDTAIETPAGIEVDIPYSAFELLTAASDDRVFYRVFSDGGATLAGYADLPRLPPGRAAVPARFRPDARFFTANYHGEPVRFVLIHRGFLNPHAAGIDSVWVQIGQTRQAHNMLAREIVLRAFAPIALMTLMAMLVVWFGIGHGLKPLADLSAELVRRTPNDLQPIQTPVPAEVDLLVTALNGFMGRLDTNISTLRDFVAETAHQLRTPLAALRAQAQVADRSDPQDLVRTLDVVERNAARLTRLINQLLSDATMTHRLEVGYSTRFDLIETIREAVHEAGAFKEGLSWRLAMPTDEAPLTGDPLMLAEAIRNVLDNAILYGGGAVEVSLVTAGETYCIDVADRGPGIPAARREHVFSRFVRADSRAPGAGLGLAIARRAIEGYGGTITLHDRQDGGLIVRIEIPLR